LVCRDGMTVSHETRTHKQKMTDSNQRQHEYST